jgi:hypothetical protein
MERYCPRSRNGLPSEHLGFEERPQFPPAPRTATNFPTDNFRTNDPTDMDDTHKPFSGTYFVFSVELLVNECIALKS